MLALLVKDGSETGHVAAIRRQTDVSASFFPDAAAILDERMNYRRVEMTGSIEL
jgi:hypothetical protein